MAAIRVGALRRGLWVSLYKGDYGQYMRELKDPSSALRQWKPDTLLFALDSLHLFSGFRVAEPSSDAEPRFRALCDALVDCWKVAREELGCRVI